MPFFEAEIKSWEDYIDAYERSERSNAVFWASVAETFHWHERWHTVVEGDFSHGETRWFSGGRTNLCYNCLDRHLPELAKKPALIWEPNDPQDEGVTLSYEQLHDRVCRFARVMDQLGVKKGDRVCLYMPMTPEAVIAMLACVRIGAVHTVVFGGFSTAALADRINDAQCKLLITADGAYRGDKIVPLKFMADRAFFDCLSVEATIVVRRTGEEVNLAANEYWWHEVMEKQKPERPAEMMDAEAPLFILYTSGSTGKPKGVLHTVGGYMTYVGYSFRNVFQPKKDDVFWCTADVGWITGHSYAVYGPLLNGATTLLFEGVPNWPDGGRFWDVCDKHKVNIFYTAPTAIRSLMTFGDKQFENKSLASLRALGTVGEPINVEAWEWYHQKVGKGKLPITDTWWQTETGGIMLAPLAGVSPAVPTYATFPLPGIFPALLDGEGRELAYDGQTIYGNLCVSRPWPGLARTTYGDHSRFVATYFSPYPGYYFTGDGCFRDEHGYRITGRVDDVINVSGHRIGTAEVENAINEHPTALESAVVGFPHDLKGQGVHAFVLVVETPENPEKLADEVRAEVVKHIGSFAKPERITFVHGLPKTRSGKIMRRILRKIAAGETDDFGDVSTLLDPAVVHDIAGMKHY